MTHAPPPVADVVPGWTPRPSARPEVLEGRSVRLEAMAARHDDGLWDALVLGSGPELWTYLKHGPFEQRADFDAHLAWVREGSGFAPLTLVVDGRALGMASYMREDADNGSVEVGYVAFGDSLKRSTAATEATYLMMRHVFEHLGYRRYEWKCDSLNAGSRAAAERFGFTYEGTFRQHQVNRGRNRDTAWFSVLDHEWPALRAAYDAWLDPANFDADGRQRDSLRTLRERVASAS